MRNRTVSLALALSLASPLALAQNGTGTGNNMGNVDQNRDNRVSQEELIVVLVDDFERADINRNRQLDQNEFDALGMDQDFELWDTNADENVDENEFYTGTFNAFDEDENAHLEGGEWDDAGDSGWFDV
jgi:hypothetical protein